MSISRITGQLCTTTTAARQTSDLPDAALIRSIAAGDKHAMQILFARHNVRVFRFLLRFVGDTSAAEDLVSDVFLDVWRQASRFQARSQVSTWLLAIARNKALSALRRRSTAASRFTVGRRSAPMRAPPRNHSRRPAIPSIPTGSNSISSFSASRDRKSVVYGNFLLLGDSVMVSKNAQRSDR